MSKYDRGFSLGVSKPIIVQDWVKNTHSRFISVTVNRLTSLLCVDFIRGVLHAAAFVCTKCARVQTEELQLEQDSSCWSQSNAYNHTRFPWNMSFWWRPWSRTQGRLCSGLCVYVCFALVRSKDASEKPRLVQLLHFFSVCLLCKATFCCTDWTPSKVNFNYILKCCC